MLRLACSDTTLLKGQAKEVDWVEEEKEVQDEAEAAAGEAEEKQADSVAREAAQQE
jgi:hypothetical protein